MWILIRYDHVRDFQSNTAIIYTQDGLVNYVNTLVKNIKDSRIVMIPKNTDCIHKKIYPIITSKACDFYVQWFDDPVD
jgi:hypothetical protein